MNDINHRICQILILLSASFPAVATELVSVSAPEPVNHPPAGGQKYDRTFPIWAQEAIDLGHELPKPYGFSIGYMQMDQPLIIDSVGFSGFGPFDDLITVEGSEAHQDSETLTLRGDFWLLPFLNFYGIFGYTQGSSNADVQLKFMGNTYPIDFDLNFKGFTYGVGGTIAGGIDNWFALLDVNYTNTNLDILDGEISSIVVSPRLGYRWKFHGHETHLWVGSMYQNVEQTFSGYLRNIGVDLPEPLPQGGKFRVEQHLEDKWNGLIGAQMALTSNVDLLLEAGIGTRHSGMISLGYRF